MALRLNKQKILILGVIAFTFIVGIIAIISAILINNGTSNTSATPSHASSDHTQCGPNGSKDCWCGNNWCGNHNEQKFSCDASGFGCLVDTSQINCPSQQQQLSCANLTNLTADPSGKVTGLYNTDLTSDSTRNASDGSFIFEIIDKTKLEAAQAANPSPSPTPNPDNYLVEGTAFLKGGGKVGQVPSIPKSGETVYVGTPGCMTPAGLIASADRNGGQLHSKASASFNDLDCLNTIQNTDGSSRWDVEEVNVTTPGYRLFNGSGACQMVVNTLSCHFGHNQGLDKYVCYAEAIPTTTTPTTPVVTPTPTPIPTPTLTPTPFPTGSLKLASCTSLTATGNSTPPSQSDTLNLTATISDGYIPPYDWYYKIDNADWKDYSGLPNEPAHGATKTTTSVSSLGNVNPGSTVSYSIGTQDKSTINSGVFNKCIYSITLPQSATPTPTRTITGTTPTPTPVTPPTPTPVIPSTPTPVTPPTPTIPVTQTPPPTPTPVPTPTPTPVVTPTVIPSPTPTPTATPGQVNITKSASKVAANPGDSVVYTITVNNATSVAVTGIDVIDTPTNTFDKYFITNPSPVSSSTNSVPGGSGVIATDFSNIKWAAQTIAANTIATYTYTLQLKSNIAPVNGSCVITLPNSAIVKNGASTVAGPAQITLTVQLPNALCTQSPGINIVKTVNPTATCASGQVGFSITVNNNGNTDDQVKTIVDNMDQGFSYVTNSSKFVTPQGTFNLEPVITYNGLVLTWDLSAQPGGFVLLHPNESMTISLNAKAPNATSGTFTNHVQVTSPVSNVATATVTMTNGCTPKTGIETPIAAAGISAVVLMGFAYVVRKTSIIESLQSSIGGARSKNNFEDRVISDAMNKPSKKSRSKK